VLTPICSNLTTAITATAAPAYAVSSCANHISSSLCVSLIRLNLDRFTNFVWARAAPRSSGPQGNVRGSVASHSENNGVEQLAAVRSFHLDRRLAAPALDSQLVPYSCMLSECTRWSLNELISSPALPPSVPGPMTGSKEPQAFADCLARGDNHRLRPSRIESAVSPPVRMQ
jgi:hypothetical protein